MGANMQDAGGARRPMRDLEKRAVKKHWTVLLDNLNTEYGLLDHLFSHERSTGIDWETYEKIRAEPVRYDRVERLLLKLLKTSSLESFIDALVKGSYSHLAHNILTTYQELEGSHTPANESQVTFARDGPASSSVEGSIPTRGRSPETNGRRTQRRDLKMCAPPSHRRLPHPLDDVKDVGKLPARASTGAGKRRRRRRSTEDRMLRDVAGTARRGRHGLTRRQGVSALSCLSGDSADCVWDGHFRRPRNPPRQCRTRSP